MTRRVPLGEARQNWADVIGTVRYARQPAILTDRGRDAVAVVPVEWYERLVDWLTDPGGGDELRAFLAKDLGLDPTP
ncbi:type II toxin-antitoxin system Phd/YefM family antitoxin [Bailinhaonella thermotolerans]|nr:type II toxin-antitoxin system Phd/YefM family antitoxin [Bailinhaonella thermotolerans]